METTKLTTEELQKINEIQTSYAELTAQMGQLQIEKILVKQQLTRLTELETKFESDYITLQSSEETFAKNLESKYGKGEVNLETGEFTKL